MGPEYRSFHIDLKALPLFRDFDCNSLAQQVFIDPVTGFTAPVTPSWQHDGYAGEADRLVKALDRKYGLRAILLRSTRWRQSGNPKTATAGRVFLSRRQGRTPRLCTACEEAGAGGVRGGHTGPAAAGYRSRSLLSALRQPLLQEDHHIGASIPRPSGLPLQTMALTASSTDDTVRHSVPSEKSRNAKPKLPFPPGSAPTQNSFTTSAQPPAFLRDSYRSISLSASAASMRPSGPSL